MARIATPADRATELGWDVVREYLDELHAVPLEHTVLVTAPVYKVFPMALAKFASGSDDSRIDLNYSRPTIQRSTTILGQKMDLLYSFRAVAHGTEVAVEATGGTLDPVAHFAMRGAVARHLDAELAKMRRRFGGSCSCGAVAA